MGRQPMQEEWPLGHTPQKYGCASPFRVFLCFQLVTQRRDDVAQHQSL